MSVGGIAAELAPRVGDLRQFASVRRIQLDDGPERGVRALAFSTGGGLDFWVLPDRALDIGPLWWRGMPLAWQNPLGFAAPGHLPPPLDDGLHCARMLSGFLLTCGLEHVRQPAHGNPLHGRLPGSPATVTAYGEQWSTAQPHLFAEGSTAFMLPGDRVLKLTRRIEAPIGRSDLSIIDTVENTGSSSQELAVLYHVNFGYPAFTDGTAVSLNEARLFPFSGEQDPNGILCVSSVAPGKRDATVTFHSGWSAVAPNGSQQAATVELSFPTAQLPWLQIWNDPRPRRNILAIEPVNCARRADGTSEPGPMLEPGDRWQSRLDFRLMAQTAGE